jgi:tetratricopeptide (TPR) repeat protein
MRKDDKLDKKENIVYFPGLKERLLSMGIEQLELKKYTEAVKLLLQAKELDHDNSEIGTALLLALFEIGHYSDAKIQCEEMLRKGIGDYFKIIDVYLTVLIQLGEYKKVLETINALIEEKEFSPEKLDHYEKLLHFSEKRVSNNKRYSYASKDSNKGILQSKNIEEQILIVAGLINVNIQPHMDELMGFLMKNPGHHPFLQTMIVNVLKEHGIEKNMNIEKFHYQRSIVPSHLISLYETPFYGLLIEFMQKEMGQKNPTLYEQMKIMVDKHFFLLYPFELEPDNTTLWAAAYHCLGLELYGELIDIDKMCELYHVKSIELRKSLQFLRQLEEISLPIL